MMIGNIGAARSGVRQNRKDGVRQERRHILVKDINATSAKGEGSVKSINPQATNGGKVDGPHERRQCHKDAVSDILKKYDKVGNRSLNRSEVSCLLTDMTVHESVTQDELDFVFKIADPRGERSIRAAEICTLLNCWENYQRSLDEIEVHFLKHDPRGTGRLNKEQLWDLLSELAGTREVTSADVNWVLKESDTLKNGVLTKPELRRALALWESRCRSGGPACCTVQ